MDDKIYYMSHVLCFIYKKNQISAATMTKMMCSPPFFLPPVTLIFDFFYCSAVAPDMGNLHSSLNVVWFSIFELIVGIGQTDRQMNGV